MSWLMRRDLPPAPTPRYGSYMYNTYKPPPPRSTYPSSSTSVSSSYSSRHLPYTRPWNGFNAVVAIHPSQLRQKTRRRFTFDELPSLKKPEFVRIRRVSSTAWETPNSKDSNVQFAKVIDNDNIFKVKIDLNMFEMFDKSEIDIYGEKENPVNPNRPLRILNRQYRLPDDVDLGTVNLKRQEDRVDVDAKKIPLDYGAPIGLNVTDVTPAGQKLTAVSGY